MDEFVEQRGADRRKRHDGLFIETVISRERQFPMLRIPDCPLFFDVSAAVLPTK
jgi:hypothetical protein